MLLRDMMITLMITMKTMTTVITVERGGGEGMVMTVEREVG